MSIERGADWGDRAPKPTDLVYVASDRAAAEVIAKARRANREVPSIGLTGGDMHRTLGGSSGSGLAAATEATHVIVDIGAALLDGRLHWFFGHLVARRSWLTGRVLVVANAAFIGPWNIAPRAHPGDGRFEILDGDPSRGDRWKARRRLPSGTHIPHPAIRVRRAGAAQFEFERPTPIHLDGHHEGEATTLSIRLEADAVDVWI